MAVTNHVCSHGSDLALLLLLRHLKEFRAEDRLAIEGEMTLLSTQLHFQPEPRPTDRVFDKMPAPLSSDSFLLGELLASFVFPIIDYIPFSLFPTLCIP